MWAPLSHLYGLHLHNSNRLPDEKPDEFLKEKASENSCTLGSASSAHRLLSFRAQEIFQVLEMCPEMVNLHWTLLINHFHSLFLSNAILDLCSCSSRSNEHYFSALNDVQVIECRFAAAAAVDAKYLRFEKMLCSLMTGTLLCLSCTKDSKKSFVFLSKSTDNSR